MAAKFIQIGEPAHDAERQALRFLVEGLPESFTVYGNAWLVERSGVVYELDTVVVAPHAIFVVEIKSYRGRIEGTDNDWWLPEKIRSPLKLNRITSQVLKSHLKNASYQAGQVWTEGLVFLSATTDVGVRGPASNDRVHTRKTILAALQDPELIKRMSGGRALMPSSNAERELLELFTGAQSGPRPVRRVREYEVVETFEHHDTFTELLGKNTLSGAERVLRIYSVPPLATQTQRDRISERARWEAQVLGRLGRSEGVLTADPPFSDEAGIVLPLEHFKGITLTTWVERYGPDARGKEKAELRVRSDLWIRIAQTIDEVHRQGVVHRLLRPDVVLVEDKQEPTEVRVTGFDLAKQMTSDATISLTTIHDDRLVYAAPEVVTAFSSAEPASDQFSLGAMLALVLTGKPLFENTRQLMAQRRLMRRVRDISQRLPLSLDEAVAKMVELRATDRYATLAEAIEAVRIGRDPSPRVQALIQNVGRAQLDADNLQAGQRIGSDYEIVTRLGQGGMAVVYAARHLVSGRTRALKIARSEDAAEEALRGEYTVLTGLDHPNIVRVIDLTKMVEGRLTLVMERVSGMNLRQWFAQHPAPEPTTQRRLAEDLIAGLDYLEQKSVTHKDLKPDNLLVSDGRLTIIDFSLASMPEDAPYGGTALYRDSASARWTHATDRFAAALCLFELYAGRHAFEGRVPEPGQAPIVADDDIQPTGLAAFFRKALEPTPEKRFPSARAMREALLVALGEDTTTASSVPPPKQIDATTPLRTSGLSTRAINALARCQVHTVGQLLALPDAQVRAIHAIGTKTANDIIAFQETLRGRGLEGTESAGTLEPPLLPDLCSSPEPVQKLPLGETLRSALAAGGLPTVGAVASVTRSALLALPGIGRKRLAEVVEALYQFRAYTEGKATGGDDGAHTLDRVWELATRPLTPEQRIAVERVIGITGEPETQEQIADDLGTNQPKVSHDVSKGLERMDLSALADLTSAFDAVVDGFGGLVRLDEIGQRFESEWPAGVVTGEGIVRVIVRVTPGRAHIFEVDGAEQPIVARPIFDRDTVKAFAAEVVRLAGQWPPVEPDTARRTLAGLLPHFDGDPLALGVRICEDVEIAETGHLFIGPVDPKHSIGFVLDQAREPLQLEDLAVRVRRIFGPHTPYPDPDHLLAILRDLDCRVQGALVLPGRAGSIVAAQPLAADELPNSFGAERSPELVVRDMLKEAAGSRGFRMLVTPPEGHAEIGRSVSAALGGKWLSFDDAFFGEHSADIKSLERAERFVAQREALTEAAEQTLFNLLEEYGRPGNVIVLGDTALFGLCEALDLPRRLYDETLSGSRGFWILVVPGVIHNRQPRFNEGSAMWHLEGATLPLLHPLPG
ncbi:serine/threonine protein kinase [Corallococcus coralloides DSM 2259]|uniref:Serine/threonine protein kinase n=1 Tax=Corallococcus coralloides (strain ATCC 25202 / DSM 2259 / NBRC 100086 / M2) TaxID=1144275 RepID=H8MUB6_CORCM|nr:protein kinase [Corallococcus coralloides]AFE10403.1 serine/threonine protein kinase [Corallococcus coralloides DSM 2259]